MILIVGLGNPGEKYNHTRHNIGFRVLDEFQKENDFPDFTLSKKFNALVSTKEFANKKIILAKPQTLMNSSGVAVKKITTDYKLPTTNLIVVHDDIDLPLGKIKISKNRGSAGHKGVESIIKELGAKNFIRIRLGIGQNEKLKMKNEKLQLKIQLDKFVLENFTQEEEKELRQIVNCASLELKKIINNV